jgi:tRNA/tmRNA/rRNA uracil-C5-methylase (TrmA/RlmC/RlmD family)
VFSQVNEAMLETLTGTARELLGPLEGRGFVDLYCGYGLFSLCLGGGARQIVGIDAEGPAIGAAQENARHAGLSQARFIAGRVTAEFLEERLRPSERAEKILLDPPRQGTGPGVVETLAKRRPEAALHIFCGTDEMPAELERWRRAGYGLARATPLDLFPGSANLETLALLSP